VGAGDPFRAAVPRASPADLGGATRRSRTRVCPHSRKTGVTSTAESELQIAAEAQRRRRRRTTLVWLARAATLAIVIGGWQLLAAKHVIDPFFYGKPSGIYKELKLWFEHGTAFGSIWLQIWV